MTQLVCCASRDRRERQISNIHIVGCHHALQSLEICDRWLQWESILEGMGKNVEEMAAEHKMKFATRLGEVANERKSASSEKNLNTEFVLTPVSYQLVGRTSSCLRRNDTREEYLTITLKTLTTRQPIELSGTTNVNSMFDQLHLRRGTAASIMVVCGSDHVENLRGKFVAEGDTVTHEDVTEADWFDPFVSEFL